MNLESFLTERSPAWEELDLLLRRARGRPERLGVDGVLELGRLYRAGAADLALARRSFPDDPVRDRLEALVLRARHAVYSERTRRRSLREFLTRGYWRDVRAHWHLLAVSLTAMSAPTLLGAVWAIHDPGAAIGLLPSAYRGAANPHAHLSVALSTQAALASSIYTHNIEVAFLTFAGGLLFGLGTLVLLSYNGLVLGTVSGLTIQGGSFSLFVRYVVPHGLLELSCISIAGVAGLRLARALIDPGLPPRGEALQVEARGAVLMLLGTSPWLVLAGLTEGFVTPRGLPLPAALAVGAALASLYWSLVLWKGRRSADPVLPRALPTMAPDGHRRRRDLARR